VKTKKKSTVLRFECKTGMENGHSRAVSAPNGRLKAQHAIVDGKASFHREGSYYLRWRKNGRQIWEAVGADPATVSTELTKRKSTLDAKAAGVTFTEESLPPRSLSPGQS
jgi:hypothetical protein